MPRSDYQRIMIRVNIKRKGKANTIELKDDVSVEDLLRTLGLPLDAHLVTIDGRPVPITRGLADGETVVIIQVASGG